MATYSFMINPVPKANACARPQTSAIVGGDASESSSRATPQTARKGAPHVVSMDDGLAESFEEESVDDGKKRLYTR